MDGGAATVTRVDACCPAPCVGVPGQGFYYSQTVAEDLPYVEHAVDIVVLPRTSTPCAASGNDFSLVSVFGHKKKCKREESNHNIC